MNSKQSNIFSIFISSWPQVCFLRLGHITDFSHFSSLFSFCWNWKILHNKKIFIRRKSLSAVQIYDYFIYSYSFLHLRDKYELTIDQLPVGLIAQLVRALHWYRRGHGFDSRSSLNFFRFLLFNCLC